MRTKTLASSFKHVAPMIAAAVLVGMGSWAWIHAQGAGSPQPNQKLFELGFKFMRARATQEGCNAANCHGAANPKDNGPMGNEFNTWLEKDKHAQAFQTLKNDESKKIMTALGGGDATSSSLCVNCHAVAAPANLQGAGFDIKEGVTCSGCHGPEEKWNVPHRDPGGANKLRQQAGYAVLDAHAVPYSTQSKEHQSLLKSVGFFDTRPIAARAEKCTGCHLAIDARLVAAGHPQPIFELAYYSSLEPPHWREPKPDTYFTVKTWAAGQIVCLRDAMNQLAQRAADTAVKPEQLKDAYEQAMAHLAMVRQVAGAKLSADLSAVGKDLASAMSGNDRTKLGAGAKKVADLAQPLVASVGTMKPDAGMAALLSRIAKDASAVEQGQMRGAQQQALSLSSLFAGFVAAKGTVAGSDDIDNAIFEKLIKPVGAKDGKPLDVAAFKAALTEITGKLVPLLGGDAADDGKGRLADAR